MLVAAAIENIGIETLEDVLPAVQDSKQLSNLNLDDDLYGPRMLTRTFRGEEAIGLGTFDDLADDRTNIAYEMAIRNSSNPLPNYVATIGSGPAMILVRVFLLADDVAAYRELMEGYQRMAAEPYFKMDRDAEPLMYLPRDGLLTSELAPAFSSAMTAAARAQAIHAEAQTAVAATRYRLDHGNLPDSLELLVPNYLDEIPLDPFDGKPMRLVHKKDQWIIYSIGPDGKDDGGGPYDYPSKKGDISFILKVGK